jgi:hypothetical protein
VPFTAGLLLVKSGLDEEKTILATIVAASLAFGAAHATNHDSLSIGAIAQSILIQGFGGILMSVLFLKYCGLRLKYVLTALVATTLYHLGWNTVLMSSILFVR